VDRRPQSDALVDLIDADPLRLGLDRLHRMDAPAVDGDAAQLLRDLETRVDHVDDERARRPEQLRAHGRHQAYGPSTDHGNDIPGFDLGAFRTKEAGGEDVADEDRSLVGHAGGPEGPWAGRGP